MSVPYIGEIRLFGFNFAPRGWAACDGSLLPIVTNEALFALLGTTYGGDGQNTFAVPDLRGRVPVHQGQGPGLGSYVIGQEGGDETVTLSVAQMPSHTHSLLATTAPATSPNPSAAVLATDSSDAAYDILAPQVQMSSAAVGPTGASQPHDNTMPTLTAQFAIATEGIFPSRA